MTGVFGEWDAPITDDMEPIDTPIGKPCTYCREQIAEGDNGAITPGMGVVHRECSYRSAMGGIGHHVDHSRYCRSDLGPDAGLTSRQSALLVWKLCVERQQVTEDDLEQLRAETAPTIVREDDLEQVHSWVEWTRPVKVSTEEASGIACRFCIAMYGLKGTDVSDLYQSDDGFAAHMRQFHHREPDFDDPGLLGRIDFTGPMGWICEDCDFYFTESQQEAEAHSDEFKHSLAVCPVKRATEIKAEKETNGNA